MAFADFAPAQANNPTKERLGPSLWITALLTVLSGWLFSRFGAFGFWGMASLCSVALPIIWSLRSSLPNRA